MALGDEQEGRRTKRKMDPSKERTKQPTRRGGNGGVNIGMNACQLARQEGEIVMVRHSIPPNACPATPARITLFDDSYMVPYIEDVAERTTQDTKPRCRVNYAGVGNLAKEARMVNPYLVPTTSGVDYRF